MADAAYLTDVGNAHTEGVSVYITLSRSNAKKIIWPELLEINRVYKLGAIPNESDLSLKFRGKSVVYVSGAKDKTEIEKFRGLPIRLAIIDEAQAFREYIRELIDEVISKALYDYSGTLCLTGTPGPIPSGFFHESAISETWSHHTWTMFDNPWLVKKSGKTPQELLQRDLTLKGVTIDDPTIQRECFAKWASDSNALVFRYDEARNNYTKETGKSGNWNYVIGVDLGFDDADAIAVIGWDEKEPGSYLVEERIETKQGITELSNQLSQLIAKYNPNRIVMDTGGLGKKIAEEIRKRFQIPVVAAEKSRKLEFIELLNDAMRTGRFFAKKDSSFVEDSRLVEWDREGGQLKISDSFHSDICDAVLYAFRESLHWLHEPEIPGPKISTPAWFEAEEKKIVERLETDLAKSKAMENDPWSWDDE